MSYEIIVVGGGHAGCEAALACARKNHKTLLISGNLDNIADMPCNPSIGGPAKGIVVREIDALGGEMAKNTDKSSLQMKILNTKKGKAVQALRAQADKVLYKKEMQKTLKNQENLELIGAFVEDLIVEDGKIGGVILADGTKINSKAVILTTGTYLRSSILIGSKKKSEGPHGEKESKFLSTKLKELGFTIKRLKTGTPPRIERSSIDFDKVAIEEGSKENLTFSYDNNDALAYHYQIPCHLVYTNSKTHEIIKEHLKESSMYGGYVEGVGPRYCPSIEDKVVRFSDKERHQLFLEPESLSYDDIYLQGFSTSMPEYVQEEMVHSLKGLENAKILRYAYAIEYDAIDSKQIKRSLETKLIEGLYTAGQINGTSGYEEAAGQGLIAGINASLKIEGKEPLILNRSESYIGVLIDDLVTKGVKDPYRLLTSRAEYRLLLRNDNADLRLRDYGYQIGLIDEETYKKFNEKKSNIEKIKNILKNEKITPTKDTNILLEKLGTSSLKDGITLYDLLKRPELSFSDIENFKEFPYSKEEKEEVEIQVQYEGYIKKQEKDTKKLLDLEKIKIPANISYDDIKNIASEAREKLKAVEPETLAQASRISGVNPADIAIIMVYLKKGKEKMTETEFVEQVKQLGINSTEEQLSKLEKLYEIMIEENKVMNLTRIISKADVYLKHFYDSLTITKVCDLTGNLTLCDVGTGAGFPGLVLKIFYPNLEITLVDALQKRVNYLNKVIKDLNLNGIEAIHVRAEDLARKGNKYDIVTARAVANLSKLLFWTMPLVKKNGYFVAMKGNVVEELEMAQPILKRKNYILDSKVEFKLPKEGSNRTILKIKYN